MRVALLLARGLVAAVFFYSGFLKLGISESFAVTILSFGIVPAWCATGMAVILPWLEVAAALLLILPKIYRTGALVTGILCILFITAVGWALAQGILVDCGCFGESAPTFGKMWLAIYRDIFLLAISAFVFLAKQKRREANP